MNNVKLRFIIVILALLVFILSGCRTGTGSIQDETIENFDLDIAREMIEKLEIPIFESSILGLDAGTLITEREFEEIRSSNELFANVYLNVLDSFFGREESEDGSIRYRVLERARLLTIFDDDIDVSAAYIKTVTFVGHPVEDARIELHIELEYTGEEDILNIGWRNLWGYLRCYIFIPDDNGAWVLHSGPPISGVAIFAIAI